LHHIISATLTHKKKARLCGGLLIICPQGLADLTPPTALVILAAVVMGAGERLSGQLHSVCHVYILFLSIWALSPGVPTLPAAERAGVSPNRSPAPASHARRRVLIVGVVGVIRHFLSSFYLNQGAAQILQFFLSDVIGIRNAIPTKGIIHHFAFELNQEDLFVRVNGLAKKLAFASVGRSELVKLVHFVSLVSFP